MEYIVIGVVIVVIIALVLKNKKKGNSNSGGNPTRRVLCVTDIGGSDPNDVHDVALLLLFGDVLDIRGVVASTPKGRVSKLGEVVSAYSQDLPKLQRHGNYPVNIAMAAGSTNIQRGGQPDKNTHNAGSRLIISEAKLASPSDPLYLLVYGSITDVALAIAVDTSIIPNIRVLFISSWNRRQDPRAAEYIKQVSLKFKLWYLEIDAAFRGEYENHPDQPMWSGGPTPRYIMANEIHPSGYLGALLRRHPVDKVSNYNNVIRFGDSTTVLYALKGLLGNKNNTDINNPTLPSWGGQYKQYAAAYWTDEFREDNPNKKRSWETVSRWRSEFYPEFIERFKRCR